MSQPLKAETLAQVIELTNKELGFTLSPIKGIQYSAFVKELEVAIQNLIDSDFEKLLNILYRIDVSETKVKKAFNLQHDVAHNLALLVIERERQKVESRSKYRQ